jgi:hydrogenase expression/formation protein HypC
MTAERPTYPGLDADWETSGDHPSRAGRYDGGFCHRPEPDGQRGVRGAVPPGDNCITCGDIAVEVRVVQLLPDALADVDTGEGIEQVSVALVSARVGDTILVHAGEAIAVAGR